MYITENELYISRFLQVMKSEHSYRERTAAVSDRYSDCLVYVLGGSCEYVFEDGEHFNVNEGDILYLAYRSSYKMERGRDGYKVIYCDFFFNGEEIRKSAVYRMGKQSQAEGVFRRLYKNYLSHQVGGFGEQMSLLYSIYGEIAAFSNKEYVGADVRSRVGRAKIVMDERYGEGELGVSQLARECGFSEVYFRKIFKSIYRLSPLEYLISVRLRNSERLLLHTSLSIEECALKCGFSSVGYFCRVFKNAFGVSPARYRRENVTADRNKYGV